MKSSSIGIVLAVWLATVTAFAAEIEGVKLADKVQLDGTELVLNGAGVRTRLFFRVYVGALYLRQKTNSAAAVLADTGPRRVAMHMLREVAGERLYAGLEDGVKSNYTPEQVAGFAQQLGQFADIFRAVKVARSGDVYLLDIVQGTGTRVIVNGELKGTVPGDEFGRALLRIWLGDEPVDASLKKAMLGG